MEESRVPQLTNGGDYKVLPAGVTPSRLISVVVGDFPKWGTTDGSTEEKVKVIFEPLSQYVDLDQEKDERCNISGLFRFSGHKKSSLRKLVSGMAPRANESTFSDGHKYWALLQKMVNHTFMVAHTPSDDGKYNNIVAAFPQDAKVAVPEVVAPNPAPVTEDNGDDFDEDDIPF